MHRTAAVMTAAAVSLAACFGGDPAADPVAAGACETTTPGRAGDPLLGRTIEALPVGIHEAALAVSGTAFLCATAVVVAPDGDADLLAVAARLAAGVGGPLLIGAFDAEEGAESDSLLEAELERLAPQRIYGFGFDRVPGAPRWARLVELPADPATAATEVNSILETTAVVDLPGGGGVPALVALAGAIRSGAGVALAPAVPADRAAPVPAVSVGPGDTGAVWVVDAGRPDLGFLAAVAAAASGGKMVVVDGADLRRVPSVSAALRQSGREPTAVYTMGEVTADADWQLDVLLRGSQVPGGGFLMVPGKRIVALYGNPLTSSLGPLGDQGPDEAVERIRRISAAYGADGMQVIPGFEIITTMASAGPGDDGNYSVRMGFDVISPWIEAARRHDVYVLLDLQPGRTDFLTQAQHYQEFLLHPHVGLALDPEWRLKPGEVHLEQIGSVRAAEVNQVVHWLADLVRDNALPQKVLLIHQFDPIMLPDRELIELRPELATVIQMDGHGTLELKMGSWNRLTAGDGARFWWGWKNFYKEDRPTPTPEDVLRLSPVTVFVSYQ